MRKKFLFWLVGVGLLVVVLVLGLRLVLPEVIGRKGIGGKVTEYPGKIVYGNGDDLHEVEWLMKVDCALRLRRYSHCGSVCAPDAEYCVEVCAYTCEFDEGR